MIFLLHKLLVISALRKDAKDLSPIFPQDSTSHPEALNFNEETIEKFRNNPQYDYKINEVTENWWTSFKDYIGRIWDDLMDKLFGDLEDSTFLSLLVDGLPYLLLLALLVLIWFYFSGYSFRRKALGLPNDLTEEERLIKYQDIRKLREAAEEDGNFRLGIRYRFLEILQKLSHKSLIHYNQFKTDEDYQSEIKDAEIKKQFLRTSRIYNFTWFGEFEISQERYELLSKEFEKMANTLQKR